MYIHFLGLDLQGVKKDWTPEFLDARRSQRASLVTGFDLHVRVISNSFSSYGLLEVSYGSIELFWVSWGLLGFF